MHLLDEVRASNTEAFLSAGKSLLDVAVLQGAVAALDADILPDDDPLHPSQQYRIDVAKALLYKVGHIFFYFGRF